MSPTFAELGVPEPICAALAKRGIHEPFEIQAATIADALAGRDVCGRAPTGSGKTLAFGIPLVATVERAQSKRPRALVLAPTRELADQISTELRSFSGDTRIGIVYGGVGYGPQVKSLRQGVEILVACPGRLEDLIDQGVVDLRDVDQVVLDEADRMADMGFMPAVRRLLDQTDADRQTVLFSATLDGDVAKLTRDYQHQPVRHEVGEETPDITVAEHVFWNVDKAERADVTAQAINAVWPAIVFCRTRHGSDRLAKQLGRHGIKAVAIHGGRSQRQRTRALSDFASGRVHAMVATDVAARGIHVDGVASVVHYDPPEDHKTYVHRSGRTARAGESGVVVSLVQSDQRRDSNKMQRKIGLDEPFIAPDPEGLRELSDAPERTLAPAAPEPQRSERPPRSKRSQSRHGKSSRSSRNGKSRGGAKNRNNDGGGRNGDDRDGDSRSSNGRKKRSAPAGGAKRRGQGSGKPGKAAASKQGAAHGSRSGSPKKGSANGAGPKKSSGPNRKARRSHLQPGARSGS